MSISRATNILHFHRNKVLKSELCILALFGTATVLATFQNIGQFFPNHLVTLGVGERDKHPSLLYQQY
jgi:hypothetical protein